MDAGTGPGTGTGACAGVALDVSASAEEDLADMKLCNGLFVEETTYILYMQQTIHKAMILYSCTVCCVSCHI